MPLTIQVGSAFAQVKPGNLAVVSTTTATSALTQAPVVPIVTSTPNPDGSIVHVVGNGQSLWAIAIAYGMKIADIQKLNNMASTNTVVYAGQKLIIRQASTPTQTPLVSNTPTRPATTPSPTVFKITQTPTPPPTETILPTVTPTLTPVPWFSSILPAIAGNQKMVGIGIVAVCVLGLIVVGFTGFRRK